MRFKRVYVEITNCCNLKCSFCPTSNRKIQFMELDFFEEILEELVGQTKHIYLHLKGEPMLHPKLDQMIELCYKKGFMVNLTTNGTLIHTWHEKLLKVQGLRQMSFSLQSFEEGTKEDLDKYLYSVFDFAKEAINKEIYVELRLWNLKSNTSENFNKDILLKIQQSFDLEESIKQEVIKEKGIRLKNRLYLSQSEEFAWPSMEVDVIHEKGTCYGLRQQLGILVDGTIVPCCLDQEGDIVLGKIGEQKLIDVLESSRVREIIKGFEENRLVEPLCQRCGYINKFNS